MEGPQSDIPNAWMIKIRFGVAVGGDVYMYALQFSSMPVTDDVAGNISQSVAIGWEQKLVGKYFGRPRIVFSNLNKNIDIFMTFCMLPF